MRANDERLVNRRVLRETAGLAPSEPATEAQLASAS
jgi:hypothetical protein